MTYTVKIAGQGFNSANVKRHLAMQVANNEQEVGGYCKGMKVSGGAYGEPLFVTVSENLAQQLKAQGFEVIESE
jgi:hypothetical protein